MSPRSKHSFGEQLCNVLKGKSFLGSRRAKKFYNRNKSVVDIIDNYTDIVNFIDDNYNNQGNLYNNSDFQFFYNYILKHRDCLDKILAVLQKMKDLGFYRFVFDEEADFTTESYDIEPVFEINNHITYVDNIVVLHSNFNHVKYVTTSSNYKINLRVCEGEISECSTRIILNSLLFDSKRLPENIDKKNIFDSILSLKNLQRGKSIFVINSLDLSECVSTFEFLSSDIESLISRIDGAEDKAQLSTILSTIKTNILSLKEIKEKRDGIVLENEPFLTLEDLKKEQQKYSKGRNIIQYYRHK